MLVDWALWDATGDLTDIGIPMRKQIQKLYDRKKLGVMPAPSPFPCQLFPDHLEAIKNFRPALVSFHFGLPDVNIIETLKSAGICVISSATTVTEVRSLAASGVDFVIAQGTEAG